MRNLIGNIVLTAVAMISIAAVAAERGRSASTVKGSGTVQQKNDFRTLAGDLSKPMKTTNTQTATLAGGCFWGMEEILRKIPGVLDTRVGYAGGTVANPTYKQVTTGKTGHAEAIEISFDPDKISYEQVLGYFFRMHDPTTLNRQHNDMGTQYRSAIFYHNDEQKRIAEQVKERVNKSGKFRSPVVTEIVAGTAFYPAEDYHQKYLIKNPGGYNCHVLRD